MPTNATKGYGASLAWGTTPGSLTDIIQIRDISGPSVEVGEVDITNQDSANEFKEWLPGFADAGEVEFNVVYTKAQCASLYSIVANGDIYYFVLTLRDGSTWAFYGFIKNFGTEVEYEDSVIENEISIRVTGKPTFAVGSL